MIDEMTEVAKREQHKSKEAADYKYALEESCIVAIIDQKGLISYANDNFCKVSKYKREDLIGQNHSIINSGFHNEDYIANLFATITGGGIWRGELKNKANDGTFYWVDTTIVPFLDEKGNPYQYVSSGADISARKETEERLEKSLKEISDYRYALDESSIVVIMNEKGNINYSNNNFCKISKYTPDELRGQKDRIIDSGFNSKEFILNVWKTMANGKIWTGELKNRAKDNTFYWINITIVPFLDERGKPYQYIAIASDITNRKLIEEENRKLNEDLEERVKQRTEEMEAFSYSISHDLRAPLRAVNGFSKILEEDYNHLFDDEGKRLLAIVQKNATNMGVLIDDLLAFSRLGRKEINKSMVDMTSLARNAFNELNISGNLKAQVKMESLYPVMADKTLMNQVWVNLLSNAIKYSSKNENPAVKITSEKKGGEIIYSITDNGVGFDMQYAHKLFGVFQRLHESEDFEGTGVGLALVHRIITKQGGKIWAKAEIGNGASFFFCLPETTPE